MKTITTLAAALALSLAVPGLALANSHHARAGAQAAGNDAGPTGNQASMMQDMMRKMMPMMMRMHAKLMDGDMPGGMQGPGHRAGGAMMDGAMMRMMMGGDMMGASAPKAARTAMLSRLAEFDADGDGSLSLAEFEALHAAMIRETTVDRFQHLDADGDGRVTEAEMAAPARRMEMRGMMRDSSENKEDGEKDSEN